MPILINNIRYISHVKYKDKYNKGFTVPYSSPKDNSINIPSIVPDDGNDEKDKPQTRKQTRRRTETPRPRVEEQPKEKADSDSKEKTQEVADEPVDKPVFKVQILASSRMLRPGSSQFKGLENVEAYKENDLVKYTYGSSTDYNEIYRLRKTILDKFPEAFIIAFKNGKKMNVNQAIREFKSK